jgi:hypothetical protein
MQGYQRRFAYIAGGVALALLAAYLGFGLLRAGPYSAVHRIRVLWAAGSESAAARPVLGLDVNCGERIDLQLSDAPANIFWELAQTPGDRDVLAMDPRFSSAQFKAAIDPGIDIGPNARGSRLVWQLSGSSVGVEAQFRALREGPITLDATIRTLPSDPRAPQQIDLSIPITVHGPDGCAPLFGERPVGREQARAI